MNGKFSVATVGNKRVERKKKPNCFKQKDRKTDKITRMRERQLQTVRQTVQRSVRRPAISCLIDFDDGDCRIFHPVRVSHCQLEAIIPGSQVIQL